MKTRDIILKLMDEQDISYTEMGKRLDTSRQNVWQWLNRGNRDMELGQLLRLLKVLGYRLMVVPDNADTPPGAIEIKER